MTHQTTATWKPTQKRIVNCNEFQEEAKNLLPQNAYGYYKSGANDEITLNENLQSWKRIFLKQKILQDINGLDTSTTVLGKKINFPLGIAPTAMHKMAHPEGEMATAKASDKKNIAFCLSTLSTCNQKEVADAQGKEAFRWFQLYATKDRNTTLKLIKQAEEYGYQAIVLTVDVPVFGKRESDERNQFKLPSEFQLKMLEEQSEGYSIKDKTDGSSLLKMFSSKMESSHWGSISWLKQATKLPIILKGIMCVEDAQMAVNMNFDGVWVSNHGGRQLDGALAPIDVLEDIAKVCKGKCEVYVDGGVRRGNDIFKAVALGADCVFVGRPSVFSLACGGQQGVEKMISILYEEFKKTMQLCGTKTVKDINNSYIVEPKYKQQPRL